MAVRLASVLLLLRAAAASSVTRATHQCLLTAAAAAAAAVSVSQFIERRVDTSSSPPARDSTAAGHQGVGRTASKRSHEVEDMQQINELERRRSLISTY